MGKGTHTNTLCGLQPLNFHAQSTHAVSVVFGFWSFIEFACCSDDCFCVIKLLLIDDCFCLLCCCSFLQHFFNCYIGCLLC